MPVYEYACGDCQKKYDVFHKVREVKEDVVCPSCGSQKHTRLMSVTSMSMAGSSSSYQSVGASCSNGSCENNVGGCCGGACVH